MFTEPLLELQKSNERHSLVFDRIGMKRDWMSPEFKSSLSELLVLQERTDSVYLDPGQYVHWYTNKCNEKQLILESNFYMRDKEQRAGSHLEAYLSKIDSMNKCITNILKHDANVADSTLEIKRAELDRYIEQKKVQKDTWAVDLDDIISKLEIVTKHLG